MKPAYTMPYVAQEDLKFLYDSVFMRYVNLVLFWGFVFVLTFIFKVLAPSQEGAQGAQVQSPTLPKLAGAQQAGVDFEKIQNDLQVQFGSGEQLKDFSISVAENKLLVGFSVAPLFLRGYARFVKGESDSVLTLARYLQAKWPGATVEIESHTDDSPILSVGGAFPSNWELSASRSAQMMRLFVEAGYLEKNIKISSRGEFAPKVPNRTPAGEPIADNRLLNRRVVIHVSPNL